MGARLTYGTAGATGGGFSAQPGSLQPHFEEARGEPHWCFQRRSATTWKNNLRWRSLWSFGCRVGSADAVGDGAAPIGRDLVSLDLWAPYSCDGAGTQTTRFLKGTCVDASDVAVANVIVQAFRTSDDLFVGEAQGHTDGSYSVPVSTVAGSTQHYLVAYKPGSPDIAGTTVNTLTNTDVTGA